MIAGLDIVCDTLLCAGRITVANSSVASLEEMLSNQEWLIVNAANRQRHYCKACAVDLMAPRRG